MTCDIYGEYRSSSVANVLLDPYVDLHLKESQNAIQQIITKCPPINRESTLILLAIHIIQPNKQTIKCVFVQYLNFNLNFCEPACFMVLWPFLRKKKKKKTVLENIDKNSDKNSNANLKWSIKPCYFVSWSIKFEITFLAFFSWSVVVFNKIYLFTALNFLHLMIIIRLHYSL